MSKQKHWSIGVCIAGKKLMDLFCIVQGCFYNKNLYSVKFMVFCARKQRLETSSYSNKFSLPPRNLNFGNKAFSQQMSNHSYEVCSWLLPFLFIVFQPLCRHYLFDVWAVSWINSHHTVCGLTLMVLPFALRGFLSGYSSFPLSSKPYVSFNLC